MAAFVNDFVENLIFSIGRGPRRTFGLEIFKRIRIFMVLLDLAMKMESETKSAVESLNITTSIKFVGRVIEGNIIKALTEDTLLIIHKFHIFWYGNHQVVLLVESSRLIDPLERGEAVKFVLFGFAHEFIQSPVEGMNELTRPRVIWKQSG